MRQVALDLTRAFLFINLREFPGALLHIVYASAKTACAYSIRFTFSSSDQDWTGL